MTSDSRSFRDEILEALADARAREGVALMATLGDGGGDTEAGYRAARELTQRLEAALAAYDRPPRTPVERLELDVPSRSEPGKRWRVVLTPRGDTCPCPARRECWHLRRARRMRLEPLRVLAEDLVANLPAVEGSGRWEGYARASAAAAARALELDPTIHNAA